MYKFAKEPLLHFLFAGAALFAFYALINSNEGKPSEKSPSIRVTAGDMTWIAENWTRQWRRPPTQSEMRGLLRDHLNEQLLAREARALGLEDGDIIIRRRLAQKLSFMIEGTSRRAEPTDEELQTFYLAHRDRFRTEARISFQHIYFDSARRKNAVADAVDTLKTLLAEGAGTVAPEAGDRSLIDTGFENEAEHSIANIFGPDFSKAAFSLKPGLWSGPILSGYGLHLVRVSDVRAAEFLSIVDIRERVLTEWRREQEQRAKAAYLDSLRRKYEVVIEDSIAPLLADSKGPMP